MCVVSMVGDHYSDKWGQGPWFAHPHLPSGQGPSEQIFLVPTISREEFDALKRDVLEMKALLKRAIKYDQDNGEPDCQMEEKVALLRRVAELVGVDLSEVLPTKGN